MKENSHYISVLVPSTEGSKTPSLGYASLEKTMKQAFPKMEINPLYLDNFSELKRSDILIANFYSTLGFIDLARTFERQGFSENNRKPFKTIVGGTGALNPLPISELVDYVVFDERNLVELISQVSNQQPKPWVQPDLVWAKNDYITSIMPTVSCVYDCVFCQLKSQNGHNFRSYEMDKIKQVIQNVTTSGILIHSATVLSYKYFGELVKALEETEASIFLGSMNLIDINKEKAEKLLRLKPKHTLAAERDSDVELYFGLESGSDKVLRRMKKPLTSEIVLDRVRTLKSAGFTHPGFYLIVGYPGTSQEDYDATANLLNEISAIMGEEGKISIKCTPFIPHLGTEASEEHARRWAEAVSELNYIKGLTNTNIKFDISDAFYYLTSVVLIRGGKEHTRLISEIVKNKDVHINSDDDIDELLNVLDLPNLDSHLKGKAPLDLSLSKNTIIRTKDL